VTHATAPGDPRDIDLDLGAVADVVERVDAGRVLVRESSEAVRMALIGQTRKLPSGAVRVEVVVDGWRFELEVEDARRADLRRRATRAIAAEMASGPVEIRAIIPGRVAAVRVADGDAVVAGQTLLVVEAMKMQNELRAGRAGTVERLAVGEGDTLDAGDLLMVVR
jgi:biotin carboxyl carrier protein